MLTIHDTEAEAITGGFAPDIKTSILINPNIFINTTPQVNTLASTAVLGGRIGDVQQSNDSRTAAGIFSFLFSR